MKNPFKIVSLFAIVVCLCAVFHRAEAGTEGSGSIYYGPTLKTSWETWYPYQYLKNRDVPSSLTGLDVQLVRALANEQQEKIEFLPMIWEKTLTALKEGTIDFASGAAYSKEREEYVYYSKPYRYEEDSLFVLRDKANLYSFNTVPEFQEYIKKNKFRLGVKEDVLYADPRMNQFIRDPNNAEYIVHTKNENENIEKLLNHEIDGYLTDRISGAALIMQIQKGSEISERTMDMKIPIYLIFSKKRVPLETVASFNKSIEDLSGQSKYENIISWYLYPVILLQTLDTGWFKTLDFLGTLFFSISGVLIANSLHASLLSAFIYAILPSIGGGILRDIIFGHRPVDALATPMYILIVCCTVIVGYCIIQFMQFFERKKISRRLSHFYKKGYSHLKFILVACDALGLAAFTVTGVMISLMAKVDPLWLWGPFFSFLTGAAGTIVRDILSKKQKLEDVEGEIYSEVAIVWGLFLSVALLYYTNDIQSELVQNLVVITVSGAFLTRMLVYFFKVPNVYFK